MPTKPILSINYTRNNKFHREVSNNYKEYNIFFFNVNRIILKNLRSATASTHHQSLTKKNGNIDIYRADTSSIHGGVKIRNVDLWGEHDESHVFQESQNIYVFQNRILRSNSFKRYRAVLCREYDSRKRSVSFLEFNSRETK